MQEKMLFPNTDFSARRTALVSFEHTKHYERFCRFLRDELWLDQYIRQGNYRLEYLAFKHGAPQYRIYRGELILYVVDTKPKKTPKSLLHIQREMAAYAMAAYGFSKSETYLTRISPVVRKYPKEGGWSEKWAS